MKRALVLLIVVGLLGLGPRALWRGPGMEASVPQDRAIDPLPPSSAALRITVFGTSLSSPPRYDWPQVVKEALSECLARPVEMTIIAQPGADITWAETHLDAVMSSQPDLILMEFATNDADLRDGISRARARARTQAVVTALIGPNVHNRDGSDLILMVMNPVQGLRGMLRPRLAGHYADYRSLASDMGIGLLDLDARWRALPRGERGLEDGLHPTANHARSVIVPAVLEYVSGHACAPGSAP